MTSLPIIVLTADQNDATARQFAVSDADAFQAKPFSRDELQHAIRQAMAMATAKKAIVNGGAILG